MYSLDWKYTLFILTTEPGVDFKTAFIPNYYYLILMSNTAFPLGYNSA